MGPIALWVYADAYRNAAKLLGATPATYDPVRYYLICHAIELALKAYLAVCGSTMADLSDAALGHNLDAILKEAEAKNVAHLVPLSPVEAGEIVKASNYYSGKVFEYPAVAEAMKAYSGRPDFDLLVCVADKLVVGTEASCKAAR